MSSNNKRKSKRVVIISDLHCGHYSGLTPESYHSKLIYKDAEKIWFWYKEEIEKLKPIDILFVNGDAIEGKGEKSGGTELIVSARDSQCKMAEEAILLAEAKNIYMIRGTPYHTGKDEDWENVIADKLGCKIGDHDWIDVNDLIFDLKHKAPSSMVPYNRNAGVNRDALWNELWALRKGQPLADVYIRSHVHYFTFSGDYRKLIMTTPAMQGFGSKYGKKECTGMVDIGFVHFDIEDKLNYSWDAHIMDIQDISPNVMKV